jgi:hypothetical protein
MKHCKLLLLLWLVSGSAFAQSSLRRIYIQPAAGISGTAYEVTGLRNLNTYPLTTTGTNSWTTAVASGQIQLTVISSGCVIAVGTRPPAKAPNCSGTPQPVQTSIAYDRVLFIGNSITKTLFNGGNSFWGMAASTEEKDYMHLVMGKVRTLNPNVTYKHLGDFPELVRGVGTGPYFESNYWRLELDDLTTGGFAQYAPVAAYKADLIVMRIAENIDNDQVYTHNLESYYKQLMTTISAQNPGCKWVLTTSSWGQTNTDAVITKVANDLRLPLVNLEGIPTARSGEAGHPDDVAMQTIADRIWAAVPRTTTVTPAPINPTGLTSDQLIALGLNGDFLSQTDQGWNVTTTVEKFIETDKLKIGFLQAGGVISYAARKDVGAGNRNLINSHQVFHNYNPSAPRYNTTIHEPGRQFQSVSIYQTPEGYRNTFKGLRTTDGRNTGQVGGLNTGRNPVQGGSTEPYSDYSPIIASATYQHPTRGLEFYVKTRPQIWALENVPSEVLAEQ